MKTLFDCKERFGTPFYLYDFEKIAHNFRAYSSSFGDALICYALKANSNFSILRLLASLGSGADCVSINEVKKALLAGIPKEKIIFSGVGKSEEEIKEALEREILLLNVESEFELDMIETIARKLGVVARISLRMNPDISADTHSYISTGIRGAKFGLSQDRARALILKAHSSNYLAPVCVHAHIGSQILDLSALVDSVSRLAGFARELLESGVELEYLDIGGGVGIDYERSGVEFDLETYAREVNVITQDLSLKLICEPGRYIVGEAGVLASSVIGIKEGDERSFVIVDAAMNDLMRPSLYGAEHPVCHYKPVLESRKKSEAKAYDIVGPICESGDFLAKDVLLSDVHAGDVITIECAGAYGFSMSNNYNLRMRICEIGLIDGKLVMLRERESFSDLIGDFASEEDALLDSKSIEDLRSCVDSIDDKIASLLDSRIKLAKCIGALKIKGGLEIEMPSRESEILARIDKIARNKDQAKELFGHIFEICKRVQK